MPFVELVTNVTLTRAQSEELALSLSACAAETLHIPEVAFGVNVRANEVLTFGGTWDPCFQLRVTSLDNLPPEKTLASSKAFSTFIQKKIGVENNRGYIIFHALGDSYIGFNGTTYAEIKKG